MKKVSIIILPAENSSIGFFKDDKKYYGVSPFEEKRYTLTENCIPYHIYFAVYEMINEGDWFIDISDKTPKISKGYGVAPGVDPKIVATTYEYLPLPHMNIYLYHISKKNL